MPKKPSEFMSIDKMSGMIAVRRIGMEMRSRNSSYGRMMRMVAFIISAVVAVLLVLVTTSHCATLIVFNDGSRVVWREPFSDGSRMCQYIDGGTYCVMRSDIVRMMSCSDGFQASEYAVSAGAFSSDEYTNLANRQAIDEMNRHKKQREAEYAAKERKRRTEKADPNEWWR